MLYSDKYLLQNNTLLTIVSCLQFGNDTFGFLTGEDESVKHVLIMRDICNVIVE